MSIGKISLMGEHRLGLGQNMYHGRSNLIKGHFFQDDMSCVSMCPMGDYACMRACLMGIHVFRMEYCTGGCVLLEIVSYRRTGLTGRYVL